MTAQPRRIRDVLSKQEIKALVTPTDREGWLAVATSWGLIAAALALAAWRPHWLTVTVALILLGGRQLGLAILMHEAAHRSLFKTKWLNDWAGKWLAAAPTWNRLDAYRHHHLAHHQYAGTARDPDLGLTEPFPTTRFSMLRKFARDLFGVTGVKRVIGLLQMDLGLISYTASTNARRLDQRGRRFRDYARDFIQRTGPVILTNAVLFLVLAAIGQAWLYLLWVGAYLTTYSLFLRVRSMAEHAGADMSEDIFRNTRTTKANWLARLTVAPHRVNYHLEHHLLMTVPHYRLRKMHRMLEARGALENAHIAPNYATVLRSLVKTPQPEV